MRSPKIAIFPTFLFALGTPLWQSRKTLHEWKDSSVLAKPLAACTRYIQQFPSYSNHNWKKSSFLRTPAFIFCLPWGRPCGNHAKRCMNEKTIQCLPNPSQHVRCTHLSWTVSQLCEPQVQKSQFSRTAAHIFVSPGDAPAIITQYVAWMERQCLPNPSQHVPIYLSIYLSIYQSIYLSNLTFFNLPRPTAATATTATA